MKISVPPTVHSPSATPPPTCTPLRGRRLGLRLALIVALVMGALVALAPGAGAANNGVWSVEPMNAGGAGQRDFFAYELAPGQQIVDTVAISNFSDEPITFAIYAKDAFNTPIDAGFGLLADEESSVDAGSWVTFEIDEITIDPQTQARIPFAMTVPTDARPGDHAGGIIATPTDFEPAGVDGEPAVDLRQRVAARMYVRVDGPVDPGLRVESLDVAHTEAIVPYVTGSGRATIAYEVSNTGNTRITPTAEVKIRGLFGRTIQTFAAQELPELLPGSSVVVTESFDGLPPWERVTTEVEITGPGASATASKSFWTFPWLVLLLMSIAAGATLWWWLRKRRRAQRSAIRVPAAPARPRESVGV